MRDGEVGRLTSVRHVGREGCYWHLGDGNQRGRSMGCGAQGHPAPSHKDLPSPKGAEAEKEPLGWREERLGRPFRKLCL